MSIRRGLVLCLIALIGCEDPMASIGDDVVLVPTEALYAPGEIVSAHIFNRSEVDIGYGVTSLRVEQLDGVRWVLIGPEGLPSLLELFVVEAGGATVLQAPLDSQLTPGTYRLRFSYLPQTIAPSRFTYSPTFEVRAGA
jgi:hypothetical protein